MNISDSNSLAGCQISRRIVGVFRPELARLHNLRISVSFVFQWKIFPQQICWIVVVLFVPLYFLVLCCGISIFCGRHFFLILLHLKETLIFRNVDIPEIYILWNLCFVVLLLATKCFICQGWYTEPYEIYGPWPYLLGPSVCDHEGSLTGASVSLAATLYFF